MESIAPVQLLVIGLPFPVISFLSLIASATQSTREHHVSPVLIPLIGPLSLSCWVIIGHRPLWWIPIVWAGDLGTVIFLIAAPSLIREWWETSKYTLLVELRGKSGIESVVIRLHQSGRYSMTKFWELARDQSGLSSCGEPGTYASADGTFTLVSDIGVTRILTPDAGDTFIVVERTPEGTDSSRYCLQGWTLTAVNAKSEHHD